MPTEPLAILAGRILAAAVGMMDQPPRRASTSVPSHRPADELAIVQIQHCCQVQPALQGPDRREVRHPRSVGLGYPNSR